MYHHSKSTPIFLVVEPLLHWRVLCPTSPQFPGYLLWGGQSLGLQHVKLTSFPRTTFRSCSFSRVLPHLSLSPSDFIFSCEACVTTESLCHTTRQFVAICLPEFATISFSFTHLTGSFKTSTRCEALYPVLGTGGAGLRLC